MYNVFEHIVDIYNEVFDEIFELDDDGIPIYE